MKLPNRKNAYISKEKLTDYLLSETHTVGKFKAKFFRTLGFDESNLDVLEKALHEIAESEDVKEVVSSRYGTKYIIDGSISTPRGKIVRVQTVWIIESGQKYPRFITAYPV